MGVGRNDPCPCGSGKKYKRCCGGAGAGTASTVALRDRALAIRNLFRFARSGEFEEALAEGESAFWCGIPDELDRGQRRELDQLEQVAIGLKLYLVLDMEVDEHTAIVDLYLHRHAHVMDEGERRILETLARARLSVYEVREVVRDVGLRLRDLWRGGEVWVNEIAATHSITRWDVIVTRVSTWPGERRELEGDAWVFAPDQSPLLLDLLRDTERAIRKVEPDLTEEQFLRELAPTVNPCWLRSVAFPPPPRLQNTDGEELEIIELRYNVENSDLLRQELNGAEAIDAAGTAEWIWYAERANDERLHLGRLWLERGELVAEVNSRERAARLRDKLAGLGVGLDVPTREQHGDPRELLARVRAGQPREGPARKARPVVSSAEESLVVREYLDRHYHTWMDEAIPALSGLTPRQAACDAEMRSHLIALLKGIERTEATRPQTASDPYDVSWIWRELGIEA